MGSHLKLLLGFEADRSRVQCECRVLFPHCKAVLPFMMSRWSETSAAGLLTVPSTADTTDRQTPHHKPGDVQAENRLYQTSVCSNIYLHVVILHSPWPA